MNFSKLIKSPTDTELSLATSKRDYKTIKKLLDNGANPYEYIQNDNNTEYIMPIMFLFQKDINWKKESSNIFNIINAYKKHGSINITTKEQYLILLEEYEIMKKQNYDKRFEKFIDSCTIACGIKKLSGENINEDDEVCKDVLINNFNKLNINTSLQT